MMMMMVMDRSYYEYHKSNVQNVANVKLVQNSIPRMCHDICNINTIYIYI